MNTTPSTTIQESNFNSQNLPKTPTKRNLSKKTLSTEFTNEISESIFTSKIKSSDLE